MQPQQAQPYMEKVFRKQQRLLDEEINHLQIIINQLQLVTWNERSSCSEEGESSWAAKVRRNHVHFSGKGQKWRQSPARRPMTKTLKTGNDQIQDSHGEKES